MKLTRRFFVFILLVPVAAIAQDLSLGMLATKIPEAGVAAVQFRNAGKPKEFLTDPLPPRTSSLNRTAQEMYQVADDVYGYPDVRGFTYFVFTQERFMQELREKSAPRGLNQMPEQILACQRPISDTDWKSLDDCFSSRGKNCTADGKWQGLISCVSSAVDAFAIRPMKP